MRVLITGATGFAGSHLLDYIRDTHGGEVIGTKRRRSDLSNITGKVELLDCELTDYVNVRAIIHQVQPDRIFHLAAQSFVPASWTAPELTLDANLKGTLYLLEAIRQVKPDARLLVAGSSEEYGMVHKHECPITEQQPLRPLSPYAVSKVAMDLLCQQYVRSYGLHIVITRAFNHTGPRRGESFVTSNFAKQIAEIQAGVRDPVIYHGNLDAIRDFTDVRDMVRAYWYALETLPPGQPFNICSGIARDIRDVLKMLQVISGATFDLSPAPDRMRPSDVPLLLGDCGAFRAKTHWETMLPFSVTLADLLQYWRERIMQTKEAA